MRPTAVGTQSQSEQSRPVCVLLPVGLDVDTNILREELHV